MSVMAVHRQLAIRTLRLVNVLRRLQRLAQSHRDIMLQLRFKLIQRAPWWTPLITCQFPLSYNQTT